MVLNDMHHRLSKISLLQDALFTQGSSLSAAECCLLSICYQLQVFHPLAHDIKEFVLNWNPSLTILHDTAKNVIFYSIDIRSIAYNPGV